MVYKRVEAAARHGRAVMKMKTAAHNNDRRVVKTKKAIRLAFAKLLSEKDINDITVSDIAALADINRHIQHDTFDTAHQLALGKGGTLEMQSAHHAIG